MILRQITLPCLGSIAKQVYENSSVFSKVYSKGKARILGLFLDYGPFVLPHAAKHRIKKRREKSVSITPAMTPRNKKGRGSPAFLSCCL